eukprot:EG_transcript_21448
MSCFCNGHWPLQSWARSYRCSFPGAYGLIVHHALLLLQATALACLLPSGHASPLLVDGLQAALLFSALLETLTLLLSYGCHFLLGIVDFCDRMQLRVFYLLCLAVAAFQDVHRGPQWCVRALGVPPDAITKSVAAAFATSALWELLYLLHLRAVYRVECLPVGELCRTATETTVDPSLPCCSSFMRGIFQRGSSLRLYSTHSYYRPALKPPDPPGEPREAPPL